MLVSDLTQICSIMVGDPNYAQVTKDMWMTFIQSAAMDMTAAGWLVRLSDDTSLVGLSNTYDYNMPQRFAYVENLWQQELSSGASMYTRQLDRSHWTLRLSGGIPQIHFYTISSVEIGMKIQIVGQGRPRVYATTADTIDPGTETFLRERAIAYASRFMGADTSELARWRQVTAGSAMQMSERTLRLLPQEFRALPHSRVVPGRES